MLPMGGAANVKGFKAWQGPRATVADSPGHTSHKDEHFTSIQYRKVLLHWGAWPGTWWYNVASAGNVVQGRRRGGAAARKHPCCVGYHSWVPT
jgi:hypothetical protein